MSILQYPGVPSPLFEGHLHVEYSEQQINGYRWCEETNNSYCSNPFSNAL
jgi:hypothetical protein